jgi:AcrR family transcriptional regulator
MPRTKRPHVRRDELLAAAQRVLLQRGQDGASVDEVTATAGAAKGTFYLYFRSKDDLVTALQEQFSTAVAESMRAAAEHDGDDARSRLAAMCRAAMEYYRDHVALHDAIFHVASGRRGPIGDTAVARLLEHAMHEADATAGDLGLASVLMFAVLHVAVDEFVTRGAVDDWSTYRDQSVGLALRMFGGSGSPTNCGI